MEGSSLDLQPLLWKEVLDMTYKQIEASREARLWISSVIIPVVGCIVMVPEARQAVADKARKLKDSIKTTFTKK
jgi:hypothetical protein